MNLQLIQKAILSEKAYALMEQGIYTFVVSKAADKKEIKKAVENQFSTKVSKIRFLSFPAKTKRVTGTRKTTQVGGGKKAIVTLAKGEKIAMLSPKTESKRQEKKLTKEPKENKGLLSKIRKAKTEEKEVSE
jgi:large subunit ribosomal protein L23